VEEGITIKEEDENEATTDSESDFDDAINGDEDIDDENM
jgi:hypothetical protein